MTKKLKTPRRLRLRLMSKLLIKRLQSQSRRPLSQSRLKSQRLRPLSQSKRLQNQLQSQRPRRRSQSSQRESQTLLIPWSQIPFSNQRRRKLPMTTRLEMKV